MRLRHPDSVSETSFLLRRNLILSEGLIAAPAAVCTDSVKNALIVCFVFCCVTALTVLLGTLIPRRVPFAIRILSYSVIAALVYIPTAAAADYLFGDISASALYLPLLSGGLLLTSAHDSLFSARRVTHLLSRLVCMLLGVCAVLLMMGAVRELLGAGSLCGTKLMASPPIPALLTPACGLILLGALCAAASAGNRVYGEECDADDGRS